MKLRLPNGVVTSYTYDMHDRLTTLVTRNASGDVLSAFRYHLDPVGNRTGMDLNQNGVKNYIRYGFDGAYRLTSETRKNEAGDVVYSESFDYDKVGNRIRQVKNGEASVYTYNRNNQLEEILANGQTVKHAYDKNGNLIRKRGPGVNESYQYDELNRMTEEIWGQHTGFCSIYQPSSKNLYGPGLSAGLSESYLRHPEPSPPASACRHP